MRRRKFLKQLGVAAGLPFTLNGVPIQSLASAPLQMLAAASDNDRVLILLQLHGGNDGLNTVIPVADYENYYNRRSNIAIPEDRYIPLDSTITENAQVGLHPSMSGIKAMYDQGRIKIVQGVSYKNNNGSHFRGRDIWFMGGGANDYYSNGWVGRFLEGLYPNYPDDYPNTEMPDPLAIEMGYDVSLIFHQSNGFPASVSIEDPDRFGNLVGGLEGFDDLVLDPRGFPSPGVENSKYGTELKWILELEKKTDEYAERLLELYNNAPSSTIDYPDVYPFNAPSGAKTNRLSAQLQIIAQLLHGGAKTKVFLVRLGGFDTHADQVVDFDPTQGGHAALLYHISSAMEAFHNDLRARGLEDRVLTVTTSEFGRRISSNASFGTDHGTGGPTLIFGKGVVPGVLGTTPDMDTANGNIGMQYDYRQVYANIMKDWMEVDDTQLDIIFPGLMTTGTTDGVTFEELPIANNVITSISEFVDSRFSLEDCYPNPVTEGKTTFHFRTNIAGSVKIDVMDNLGRNVLVAVDEEFAPGEHKVEKDLSKLPKGSYTYKMKVGHFQQAKKLVVKK